MSFIKTKELPLPDGTVVKCDPSVVDALNKVRDIYIQDSKWVMKIVDGILRTIYRTVLCDW